MALVQQIEANDPLFTDLKLTESDLWVATTLEDNTRLLSIRRKENPLVFSKIATAFQKNTYIRYLDLSEVRLRESELKQ